MAKYFNHEKTNTKVASGKVKSIGEDGMSFVLETSEYNRTEKKNVAFDVTVKSSMPLEDMSVGQNATVVGFPTPDINNPDAKVLQALYVSNKNEVFEYGKLAVVNGEVLFAGYNEEKNEDGSPRMTKPITKPDGSVEPAHEKKPHFDVTIKTAQPDGESTKYVLHTMKLYPYKGDTTQVERYKKLFANFDRETNPVYATIVTQPGQESSHVKQVGDKEYTNFYSNHMGMSSVDVEFIKSKEKTAPAQAAAKEEKSEDKAEPSAPASAPVQTQAPQAEADDDYFLG